uniref:hypothetical protein n=1 Tax=Faecalibacterium sp. TaxID=1971605 RepID=UPI003FED5597
DRAVAVSFLENCFTDTQHCFSPSFFAFFARKIAGTYSLTTQPKGVTLWVMKQRRVMKKKEVFP